MLKARLQVLMNFRQFSEIYHLCSLATMCILLVSRIGILHKKLRWLFIWQGSARSPDFIDSITIQLKSLGAAPVSVVIICVIR